MSKTRVRLANERKVTYKCHISQTVSYEGKEVGKFEVGKDGDGDYLDISLNNQDDFNYEKCLVSFAKDEKFSNTETIVHVVLTNNFTLSENLGHGIHIEDYNFQEAKAL